MFIEWTKQRKYLMEGEQFNGMLTSKIHINIYKKSYEKIKWK